MKKALMILALVSVSACARTEIARVVEIGGDMSLRQKSLLARHISSEFLSPSFKEELAAHFPDAPRAVLDGLFFSGTKHLPSTRKIEIRFGFRSPRNQEKAVTPLLDYVTQRVESEVAYRLKNAGVALYIAQDEPGEGLREMQFNEPRRTIYLQPTPVLNDVDIQGANVEHEERRP